MGHNVRAVDNIGNVKGGSKEPPLLPTMALTYEYELADVRSMAPV